VAILVAILFLWLEEKAYEYKSSGGPPVAMVRVQDSGCMVQQCRVGARTHAVVALGEIACVQARTLLLQSPIPNLQSLIPNP